MDELKEYLDNHKGFRLTKEMIEKIVELADVIENNAYETGNANGHSDYEKYIPEL